MSQHDAGGSLPALRTDRLGRRYARVWGLRDCTLEVPAGAVVGLVGPNGAGKTTRGWPSGSSSSSCSAPASWRR
jgi:ABC-type uncharacterized transport system ATPase subunit